MDNGLIEQPIAQTTPLAQTLRTRSRKGGLALVGQPRTEVSESQANRLGRALARLLLKARRAENT